MSDIEKAITGKTIKTAEINGFRVQLTFDDGTTFDYDASDGGYSSYCLYDTSGREIEV